MTHCQGRGRTPAPEGTGHGGSAFPFNIPNSAFRIQEDSSLRYLVICLALCLCLAVSGLCAAPQADFYVSPQGNDSWSGRLSAPSSARTDGPFATLGRAQSAVRDQRRSLELKQASSDGRGITVLIRGGVYYLSAPITFTPEDSGTRSAPVVYAAYPGEKPVISGGVRLSGWSRTGDGRWQAQIPEAARGEWYFQQLFVNGERRFRPRLPRKGYYYIDGEVPYPQEKWYGADRFRFKPGDIRADWRNLGDVEVLPFHYWTMSRLPIASLDEHRSNVLLTGPTAANAWWCSLSRGTRYLVENVKEALRDPGEWYLDRTTGVLTYIPRRGETMRAADVVAPRLDRLVEFKGDLPGRRWVEGIVLRGLSFQHSNWVTPARGSSSIQSEVELGAAIRAEGARWCGLERCSVSHTGEYAVEWGRGCKYNRVTDCELTDLGAGGVKIGEPGPSGEPEMLTSHNTVSSNLIAHAGRIHPAGVGVLIESSPYNLVTHNDIYDLYYTGISAGWRWGYETTYGHDNTIADNHISRIGQGVLSDMGGIYHLGVADGTVIRHNLLHDISYVTYGGWGIYLDAATTHVLVEDNIVYRAFSGGFHQNFGKENTVRNNIFAFGKEAEVVRSKVEPHLSFTFTNNIVYWESGPLLGGFWTGDRYALDHNLYWNASGRAIDFAGRTPDEWRRTGQDVNSIIADPLFVDPARGDFRLKPGSPAGKIGFRPIDMAGFGRTGDRAPDDGSWPRAFPAAEPQPLTEDFESTPVGEKAPGMTAVEESDRSTVRVTDEVAASGRHSLKFADAAGQQFRYNPHAFYNTSGMRFDTLVGRFSIRLQPGAILYHEWRDSGIPPYHAGPSIRVESDGSLVVGGKTLVALPHDQWVRLRITCKMGDRANGKYDLEVRLPGEKNPLQFHDLACDPYFRDLKWYGFASDADTPVAFYVDDIELRPGGGR